MENQNRQAEPDKFDTESLRRVLHDLSNTMTGLLMNAGLLNITLRGNDKLRRYAEEIAAAGEHSAMLVKEARNMVAAGNSSTTSEVTVTHECDSRAPVANVMELLDMPSISSRTQ